VICLQPTDFFADTTPKALEVFLALQRSMPTERKIAQVFELTNMLMRLSEQRVRELYPEASEREVFLIAASRRLGRNLMIGAYGWDPDAYGPAGHSKRL
jgi:hypothetical protein